MNLTLEQLRQNGSAVIAALDGKPIQWTIKDRPNTWNDCQLSDIAEHFGEYLFRPKPWTLPAPPAGRKWHREDWTEELLAPRDGKPTRPLMHGEKVELGDEYRCDNDGAHWVIQIHESVSRPEDYKGLFHRTTRPLPKQPVSRPWNCMDDVPAPLCYIEGIGNSGGFPMMVISISINGVTCHDATAAFRLSWKDLEMRKYSTDRKTWLPCAVMEEGE